MTLQLYEYKFKNHHETYIFFIETHTDNNSLLLHQQIILVNTNLPLQAF